MKLLSIRLHPFGGTPDRSCTLADGLNVLEGPNEFGKSTLSHALWHGLFTATNLTPARLKQAVGRWYPLPGGDHASVTLEFESDGHHFTLQKTWGAGSSAKLQASGSAAIADPGKVQETLLTLLRRNEATWRHILFTSQAQLSRTLDDLQSRSGDLDDVQSLLVGVAAIPGDIAPEKLVSALNDRVEAHFSRWDTATHGPEKGKGIDNPWANRIGPVLASHYATENVRRELGKVVSHENDVDDVNRRIQRLKQDMAADEEFVAKGRSLRDGLAKRDGLEERCKRLSGELQALKQIMIAWPGAAQMIQGREGDLETVKKELATLDEELKNARKRVQATELRQAHAALAAAGKDWETAAAALVKSKPVDAALLAELKVLEPEITRTRIQIAAQKLTARVECSKPVTVTVERGTHAPETLTLSPAEAWSGEAEGKFQFTYQDLKLSVESGSGDMAALFANLDAGQLRHGEILIALGHDGVAAAELADKAHHQLVADEKNAKKFQTTALRGRSEDEWKADMEALANLPETRSVEVLETEKTRLLGREAKLGIEIGNEKTKVEEWVREHHDVNTLTDRILARTAELQKDQSDLASLPMLPDGFSSIPQFLTQLSQKEAARDQLDEQLGDLKVKQAQLTGAAPESTAEDLRAEWETRDREFQRQQSIGQALLRIRSKLDGIVSERDTANPMQGLADTVSRHFKDLTCGRYETVRLDGSAPVEVSAGHPLDPSLLSQGTLGSLALATRLALAELYLKDMDGFFLLDDPFTDMDATRRQAAVQAIGTFASQRQVLFFTCHTDHARELQSLAGARDFQLT
jgi:hypothetical protein